MKLDKDKVIAELKQQFFDEGCCPVCNQKKRPSFTEDRKKTMSKAMKGPRKRVSPTTTKILVAIKNEDSVFTLSGIAKSTGTAKNTVREIVRRLVLAGEIMPCTDMADDRVKSSRFGTAEFWQELEREGNVALKSLPK